MAHGSPGIRRVFPCDGDHLDHLFRRQGGRRPRAWVIRHRLLQPDGKRLLTARVGFPLLQLGGEGAPPPAPHLDCPAMEVPLASSVALVGSRLQGQKNLGAPSQTLGTGLTACHLLQAGPLSCGQLPPRTLTNCLAHRSYEVDKRGIYVLC